MITTVCGCTADVPRQRDLGVRPHLDRFLTVDGKARYCRRSRPTVPVAIPTPNRDLGLGDGFTTVTICDRDGCRVAAVLGIGHALRGSAGGGFTVTEIPGITERIAFGVFGGSRKVYRQRGVPGGRYRAQRDARWRC